MNTFTPYDRVARALHWTIAILILGLLAIGFLMGNLPDEPLSRKIFVYNMHKSFGLTVLVLSLFRLLWRLTHKAPALPSTMKKWEIGISHLTHFLFYVFMIVMPLVGWALVSTSKFPSKLFNLVNLPYLPFLAHAENKKALHEVFEETHELLAFLAIALIVLHVAAALKHHYKDKDTVLARMLPRLHKDV